MDTQLSESVREARRRGGRKRAEAFTSDYQRAAGRASYCAAIERYLRLYWPDLERAAQALTGLLRLRAGYKRTRGVTRDYMRKQAERLNLFSELGEVEL